MNNRKLSIKLNSAKSLAELEFATETGQISSIEINADQLMSLIEGLGQARSAMSPGIPNAFRDRRPKGDGSAFLARPKIEIVKLNGEPLQIMAIRSTAYGWLAVALSEEDVGALVARLAGTTDIAYTPTAGNS